jgi:hypothetical protein
MPTQKADDPFCGPFCDEDERKLIESIDCAWADDPPS